MAGGKTERMRLSREIIRSWIADIERRFHVSRNELAQRAGVKPSTVYRWFDDRFGHMPAFSTLQQIADAFGVELPGTSSAATPAVQGFAEGDAAPWEGPPDEELQPNQSDKLIATRALELIGYLPGDVARLDMSVPPRPGDVVFAQVYDLDRGVAQTRLRLYDPPFLLTRSLDPAIDGKPLYVDGARVAIVGPVVKLTRLRKP